MRHGNKQTDLPRPDEGSARDDRLTTEQLAGVRDNGRNAEHGYDAPPTFPGEATAGREANAAPHPGSSPTAEHDGSDGPGAERRSEAGPLLGSRETEEFRNTWRKIQSEFVDRPKDSVRSADALVAEVMQTLARTFASHKNGLEGQWARGSDVATEDLRVALQHYRSFFNRLLSA